MHGRKAYQLVKEFAGSEKGHLKIFNVSLLDFSLLGTKKRVVDAMEVSSVNRDGELEFKENMGGENVEELERVCGGDELFERVAEECNEHHNALQSLIRKMQEEGLEVQTARNADHYGALVHHLSLIRNKRCLMAYVYNRAEIIRDLAWKVGLLHELPCEIKEKFSDSEEQYFKDHSKSLKMYMSQLSLDVNVDMVPPKDPYIKVRVLEDLGSGIILSDKSANFASHSMHFLKRTDAEQYIARGLMEELIS
ncbi:hypothetical protein CXB51_012539 [Gossypium anomalum]|uniref:GINS subunit domain-containing protein n=5 Tax=Gossypium TaxID=3633 RepID=A0A8J5Z9V0_9ROSI|nr:hypothetical protein CXB51_012539 [Gossypium anomalum]